MKTFKTQVYLNQYAVAYCERAFGVRRVIWNWALNQFNTTKKATGQYPNNYNLDGLYRKLLKDENRDDTFNWLLKQQASPQIMVECLKDISMAFSQARKMSRKVHHKVKPQFKTKKDRNQSFRYYHVKDAFFRADSDHIISLSTVRGGERCVLRTRENVSWIQDDNIKLCTITVSKKAGKYWICVCYEKLNQTDAKPILNGKIGLDLGIVKSVVSYDGTTAENVNFNTKRSKHNDRLSKSLDKKLSKKVHGSKNYERLILLKEKREVRASRIRKEQVEVYTTMLANTYSEIVIDDFSFKKALRIANPDKAYRCMNFMFKERLAQKVEQTGAKVKFIDHKKGIKTTRKCHCCGSEQIHIDLKRVLHCQNCGEIIDRDFNAAINCFKLQ